MKKLHPKQRALLALLRENMDAPLTIQELKEEMGVSSKSVVHHHITQLEKKGYLKRSHSNPRDYQILEDPEKPIVYLNLYGLAECGPNGSILDGNPIDRIPIASRLLKFAAEDAFMVKAKGDSMLPRIHQGDYVIARKQNYADRGEMVVCVHEGRSSIKIFHAHKGMVILSSVNSENYSSFNVEPEDFRIEGVVKNIIQYH